MKKIGGYIAVSDFDRQKTITQEFKGEVMDEPVQFPKGLGAKHPFNFQDAELLYEKYAIVSELINKDANSIITDFEVKVDNPNAQAIIDKFIHDNKLHQLLREWTKEGLLKGNGYFEIDLPNLAIRVLNTNHIYIRRNNKGRVLEYNQWLKPLKQFTREGPDLVSFKPNQIAHLPINKIPNKAYGMGLIYPNERVIQNLIKNEQDLQIIVSRKAGQPYHIKVGQPGQNVPSSIVDAVKAKLDYLRNTHEWVTDGDVEITSVSFSELGKNIIEPNMYWYRMFLAGYGIPEVHMGSGQLNEGIAKVQDEGYKRRISSFQTLISNILEEKLFKPILLANGFDLIPEFIWELPTEESINERLKIIDASLVNALLSPEMRAALEIEKAKLLGFEDLVDKLVKPEDARELRDKEEQMKVEREREENIPQPETPGAKKVNQSTDMKEHNHIIENVSDMPIRDWINIKEMAGFNYIDYLTKILEVIKKDPFVDLKAITEQDIANGLLPENEVEKLRLVLRKGFKDNQSVKQIEKSIKENVKLTDRITETGAIISAETRPNMIARTETVRLANEGLVDLYKENKIKKVSWLSAISDRTCPQCEALNGQVFEITNLKVGVSEPPLHVNCRCSLLSVLE